MLLKGGWGSQQEKNRHKYIVKQWLFGVFVVIVVTYIVVIIVVVVVHV